MLTNLSMVVSSTPVNSLESVGKGIESYPKNLRLGISTAFGNRRQNNVSSSPKAHILATIRKDTEKNAEEWEASQSIMTLDRCYPQERNQCSRRRRRGVPVVTKTEHSSLHYIIELD